MPSFQYSPSTDPSVFFESAANWTLTSVSATKAIWESGDQKLEVTGTGLSLAGGGAGTITGVKLYDVDLSSGSAVDKQVMTSAPGLSMAFSGLVSAVAESLYGFGGFGFIFGGNDTLTGSAADDYMSGFGGNDSIVGNAGNDYLSGDDELNEFGSTGGRDTLVGGDGNDVLSGGGGNDSMVGGNGNDYYFVTDAGDRVVEATGSAAGAADRVNFSSQSGLLTYTLPANVENLEVTPTSMSSTPITVTANGNALSNKISVIDFSGGFNMASTRLFGLDGNDRLTGGGGRDSLDGGNGNDTLIGGAGNDLLLGRAGVDQLSGGAGNDTFSMNNKTAADRVTDFKLSGSDKLLFDQSDLAAGLGDGDNTVEGAVSRSSPGGFAKTAELAVFTSNIAGAITTSNAAAKIGSATSAYAIGDDRIFVVDNGVDSAVFLFTAKDADSAVEAVELTLLATLAGTASTATTDYLFGA